ncbi:hypothetical protein IIA79_06020 [bacterium]|nr:hypothetical protein [bacterium]
MQRFSFRLEKLESVRGMELDAMRQAMAEAEQRLRQAEEELLMSRNTLELAYDELMKLRLCNADPVVLLSLETYACKRHEHAEGCLRRVDEQGQALLQARDRLTGKHKEKRVLEKYRARQFTEYSRLAGRQDQRELDEAAKNAHSSQPSQTT